MQFSSDRSLPESDEAERQKQIREQEFVLRASCAFAVAYQVTLTSRTFFSLRVNKENVRLRMRCLALEAELGGNDRERAFYGRTVAVGRVPAQDGVDIFE